MRFARTIVWLAVGMGACAGVAEEAGSPVVESSGGAAAARVIEDPMLGRRWVLRKDVEHPGGPGRLVEEAAGVAGSAREIRKAVVVIRAGDRVLVEENTRVARGLLEGVAMDRATKGATFRVRLRAGGRVVRAVATWPGRAVLAGADGGQP